MLWPYDNNAPAIQISGALTLGGNGQAIGSARGLSPSRMTWPTPAVATPCVSAAGSIEDMTTLPTFTFWVG